MMVKARRKSVSLSVCGEVTRGKPIDSLGTGAEWRWSPGR